MLLTGLWLVLGIPFSLSADGWAGFGFHACPLVTVGCEWAQTLILVGFFCGVKGLHKECWPEAGLSWAHITRDRVCQFVKIYIPAALTSASDWYAAAAAAGTS